MPELLPSVAKPPVPPSGRTSVPDERLPAALVSGTSGEYLGRRPLPHALLECPLVVIAGPVGVGKTTVALKVAGDRVRHLERSELHGATVDRVRRRRWPENLTGPEPLVLDGPVYLPQRPAAAAALQELICQRVDLGHRTLLVEGTVRDGSLGLLMDVVPPEQRITVMLRFPGSRGRARFARQVCAEFGLPWHLGRGLHHLEPWSYAAVREALRARRPPETG
ncbi:MAG: hypothetical protein JXB39_09400 [Deltaproteobacteria bacterium]|nr:hypothetical protein [Deltaproteobacteria bacterium]